MRMRMRMRMRTRQKKSNMARRIGPRFRSTSSKVRGQVPTCRRRVVDILPVCVSKMFCHGERAQSKAPLERHSATLQVNDAQGRGRPGCTMEAGGGSTLQGASPPRTARSLQEVSMHSLRKN
eukprot:5071180-Prymnesium_polylepis.1